MANQAETTRRRRKSAFGIKAVIYLFVFFGILIAALPTATVFAVGLVPTVVALIVDVTPGRYLTRCVAGLNVAGMSPFVHNLWTQGNDMMTAVGIVTDAVAWLVIYGAAAMGWLLFLGFPGAVAVFQTLNAKRRIYLMQEKQKTLLEEWGDSIRSPAEIAKNGATGTARNEFGRRAESAAAGPGNVPIT